MAWCLGDGDKSEVDVHGLEAAGRGAWFRRNAKMPPGDVGEQRTERRCSRRRRLRKPEPLSGCKPARQQPDGRALDIPFDARDLTGKPQPRIGLETQRPVEQLGRIEIRVAMQPAETGKFRVGEAGDHAQHARLLAVLQLGLEADHIPQ